MANSDLVLKVGLNVEGFGAALQGVMAQCEAAAKTIEKSFGGITAMGSRLAGLGAGLTAGVSLPLEEIGRHAIEAASDFEQVEVAFTAFLGSAAKATAMTKDLYNFAATTPFQIPGILQGARQLMAMQFSAKDTIPILRTLGDTAAGLGVGQEGLERLVFHLGQIQSQGGIDGKILREFSQMGIGAAQMLGDGFDMSASQIKKAIHDKILAPAKTINVLLTGLFNEFGGMMGGMMGTLSGAFSNFKDQATLSLVAIGNTLLPLAKQVLAFATDAMNGIKNLAEWFGKLPAPVQAAAGALAAISIAVGVLVTGLGGMMMVFGPLVALAGAAILPILGWGAAIVAATAALVGLGVWVSEHWAGVKAMTAQAWSGVKEIWNATIGTAAGWLKALMVSIRDNAVEFYKSTSGIWEGVGQSFRTAFGAILSFGGAFVTNFKAVVIDPFISLGGTITEIIKIALIDPMSELFQVLGKIPGVSKAVQSVGDAFKEMGAKVEEGFSKIGKSGAAFAAADSAAQKSKALADRISADMATLHMNAGKAPQIQSPKDAWNEKHTARVNDYTKAVNDLREAQKLGGVSADQMAEAEKKLSQVLAEKQPKFDSPDEGGGAAKSKTVYSPVTPKLEDFIKTMNMVRAGQQLAEVQAKFDAFKATVEDGELGEKAEAIGKKLIDMGEFAKKGAIVSKDSFKAIAEGINEPFEKIKKAYETLGVASSLSFREQAAEATKAYDTINKAFRAGMGTADDVRKAWIAMTEAQIKSAEALDQDVPAMTRLGLAIAKMDVALKGMKDQLSIGGMLKTFSSETFAAMQTGMTNFFANAINGTKRFKANFLEVGTSILSAMGNVTAKLLEQWIVYEAGALLRHVLTSTGIIAVTAVTAETTNSINAAAHAREAIRDAETAAQKAFTAAMGLPFPVNVIVAPVAAAAAFAGVMALGSASQGALLPNSEMLIKTHPREMILPKHLSEGIQGMIRNGSGSGGGGNNQTVNQTNNYTGSPAMSKRQMNSFHDNAIKRAAKHLRNNAIPRFAGA